MTRPANDAAIPVVLVGPTASGKSSIAMEVARRRDTGRECPIEIVSADAMQVYRGLDIGTAKPTRAEQAEVRHWCLDLAAPSDRFTVADYAMACRAALTDIAERGSQALIVGGTGLYVSAIVDDLEIPGEWPEIRRGLEQVGECEELRRRLVDLDPVAAGRIPANNRRRLVRALEVSIGSGRAFSSYGDGLGTYRPRPFVMVGIRWSRGRLRERIADRVHAMVDAGLVDEVAALHQKLLAPSTAGQAIGYKEIIEHLEGRMSIDEAIAAVILRTGQLAVAQDKWFRRDPRITWIDVEDDPVREAADAVAALVP